MFIFLSKFLPLVVYPIGLACLILIVSLFIKKPRWQRAIVICAFLLLFLGGNRWITLWVARSLEWQFLPPADMPHGDAIVILGGGTDAADYPRPIVDLSSAGDRVIYGGMLYKQGKAPLILLSWGNISWLGTRSNTPAEQMAEILNLMDVPSHSMLLQMKSLNTYEDALYSSQMLKDKGIQKIILVTSAMHMPRSVALFQKQGMDVIPAPTDYRVTQSNWDELIHPTIENFFINLIPSSSNISELTNAIKEYIGIFVYRLWGWM
jgi:uncharacterized SAM-binding protein YcdF (DUF218 family)